MFSQIVQIRHNLSTGISQNEVADVSSRSQTLYRVLHYSNPQTVQSTADKGCGADAQLPRKSAKHYCSGPDDLMNTHMKAHISPGRGRFWSYWAFKAAWMRPTFLIQG